MCEFFGREGLAQIETLKAVATLLRKEQQLFRSLNTFSSHDDAENL